ncbi:PLAT/LH2 domain-containing protein [Sorangium sp. So ce1000]|uniref:PLAT/LH2 domain-containing protein n=1 Tax=Sorangium sp. So ce1000 TaxID=3133325 RepID=UPI003F60EAAE
MTHYKITTVTGTMQYAQTYSHIFVTIHGRQASSKEYPLKDREGGGPPFQLGQTDVFDIDIDEVIGEPTSVTVRTDNENSNAGWWLVKLTVQDKIPRTPCEFPCNAWIGSDGSQPNDPNTPWQRTLERSYPIFLDYCELGERLPNGWNDEGGAAATFTIYSKDYRLRLPVCTWQLDGHNQVTKLTVAATAQHFDRNGVVDECTLNLVFTANGALQSAQGTLTARGTPGSLNLDWSAPKPSPAIPLVVQLSGKLFNDAGGFLVQLGPKPGQLNFPAIINHVINEIDGCIFVRERDQVNGEAKS